MRLAHVCIRKYTSKRDRVCWILCVTVYTHAGARKRAASRLIGERRGKSLARPIETSSSHLFPISRLLVIGYRVPTNKCTRAVFADCLILSNPWAWNTCEFFSDLCMCLYFSFCTDLLWFSLDILLKIPLLRSI